MPFKNELVLDPNILRWEFVRSSGPGGQNVNKVATAVQLRFDAAGSASLPADVKERLRRLAGARMTRDGIVVINARRYRSQERNREDAVDRLVELVRSAAKKPLRRIKSKPTRESKERRLEDKKHRSRTKRRRGPVIDQEE